jgi:hypothetical protein
MANLSGNRKIQSLSWLVIMASLVFLAACEPGQGVASGSSSISDGTSTFAIANDDDVLKAKWVKDIGDGCFTQRFVQPPKKGNKNKSRPRYLLSGPWAELVDLDSLELQLNEKNVNFSVDLDSGELIFSNPGHSKAVIDVTFCLVDDPDVGGNNNNANENANENGNANENVNTNDNDGAIIVDDSECEVECPWVQ